MDDEAGVFDDEAVVFDCEEEGVVCTAATPFVLVDDGDDEVGVHLFPLISVSGSDVDVPSVNIKLHHITIRINQCPNDDHNSHIS